MRASLTLESKNNFKSKFSFVKNKEELLSLLNEVAELLFGEVKGTKFELKHLTFYANPDLSSNRFKPFNIKKRSGKLRTIHAPASGLKVILKCLAFLFEANYTASKSVTGFVSGKSIVDNAKQHVYRQFVYNIDLKDFFYSFDRNSVKMGIWRHFFYMEKEYEKIAFFLSALCTHPLEIDSEIRIVLPQGAPTSPILTNILCVNLDRRLAGLAKRFRVRYTRYADDITFSSDKNIFNTAEFQKELKRIISDQNLMINPDKTRLQKRGFRQEVTGIIVNRKLNVHHKFIKQIRMWLYYMETYGVAKAEIHFRNDYVKYKGHIKRVENPMFSVISGKLLYLKMVKGEEDTTYQKLKSRFDKFSTKYISIDELFGVIKDENITASVTNASYNIDTLLNIWEDKGIDEAIKVYVQNKNAKVEDKA